ncbi:MAG: MFS transporter [Isosphaera sp.]|nr:MFS transporter [Isosphaera sp.]
MPRPGAGLRGGLPERGWVWAMVAAMIEVRGVSKRFGRVWAVRDVTLSVTPGRVTGLLGPNGAGKTTLIRMITSFLLPSAGSVVVGGHDAVVRSLAARGLIGYLPESAPLYPEMTVGSYLRFRAGLFGIGRRRRGSAIDRAVDRCALADVRRRRIGELSKGYRQRVGLAAAILHDPPVLILDEPTSGLDPTQIVAMRGLIAELSAERPLGGGGALGGADASGRQGRVMLLSSHILPEVEQTCGRVVIMARGRVRADGTPGQLMRGGGGVEIEAEALCGSVHDATALDAALSALGDGVVLEPGPRWFGSDGGRWSGVVRVPAGAPATPGAARGAEMGEDAAARVRVARAIEPLARAGRVTVTKLAARGRSLERVFVSVVESAAAEEERPAEVLGQGPKAGAA